MGHNEFVETDNEEHDDCTVVHIDRSTDCEVETTNALVNDQNTGGCSASMEESKRSPEAIYTQNYDASRLIGSGRRRGSGRSGLSRARGRGRGRGRARGRGLTSLTNNDAVPIPTAKIHRKPRIPKEYKPSDMVRRIRKIKVYSDVDDDDIPIIRERKLKIQKQDSSWEKEVAATLQNVIKNSKLSKKYRAVGRPRKRVSEAEGSGCKKIKSEVTAYPIIEVVKKENDWNVETKYTIPGFCCNDCGAVYQSTAALRRHQNYECGKEPQFKCNDCDYAAKHKGTLKSHIKNRHLPKEETNDAPKKPRKPRQPKMSFLNVPSPT